MNWLTNQFLVAMPSMSDSIFERTVVLVCMHDEDGALGIVVNRITELLLEDILKELDLDSNEHPETKSPVHFGGPCQVERGLVLHDASKSWASTILVGNNLGLTMSKDVLEAISENRGPDFFLPVLGFAGWESEQLEDEMRNNMWLSAPADSSIIFDTPIQDRWHKAASLVGIDIDTISSVAGHA